MSIIRDRAPAAPATPAHFPPAPTAVARLWRRRTEVFVWASWAGIVLAAGLAIPIYGWNLPFAEDWLLLAPLTANEPSMWDWLWKLNSEHLIPVPKLILVSLLSAAGGDFRAGMVLNLVLLGAVAAAMILVARQVRGGETRVTDAFFPLIVLHLGHWDNIFWSWQLHIVLSTTLTCVLLLMMVRWREGPPSPAAAAAAALCILALPLSGGNGTLMTPALALWMMYCGLRRVYHLGWRRPNATTDVILVGSSTLAVLVVVGYLAGYERSDEYPVSSGTLATVGTVVKFIAFGFGPAARYGWILTSLAALAITVVGAAVLVSRARTLPVAERPRMAGLLLLVAGRAGLAATLGWARAGKVEATGYMSTRYALFAVPLLVAAYFAVELYATGGVRRLTQGTLFLLALVLLPLNMWVGLQRRDWFDRGFSAFHADVQAGATADVLAERHYSFLLPWSQDDLAHGIRLLEQSCLGPFADHRASGRRSSQHCGSRREP